MEGLVQDAAATGAAGGGDADGGSTGSTGFTGFTGFHGWAGTKTVVSVYYSVWCVFVKRTVVGENS